MEIGIKQNYLRKPPVEKMQLFEEVFSGENGII
jgi:hypothetical protein